MADLSKIRALDCELSVRTLNLIRRWYGDLCSLEQLDMTSAGTLKEQGFTLRCRKELDEFIENARAWIEPSLADDKLAQLQASLDAMTAKFHEAEGRAQQAEAQVQQYQADIRELNAALRKEDPQ